MKNIIRNLLIISLLAVTFAACKEEPDYGDYDRTSVVTLSKSSLNIGWESGSTAEVTVTVPRFGWKAECEAEWLTLSPDTVNVVGSTKVTLTVAENSEEEPRTTTVRFVSGNVEQTLDVKQVGYGQIASEVNHPDGNANKWMFEHLKEMYLWNDLLTNVYPDYACDYNNFLSNTLIPLRGNELDGGRRDGARYLYSYVQRSAAPRTRATSSMYPSFGFATMSMVAVDENLVYLRITSINPESPAERAEILRGEYVGKVNGEEITRVNASEMYNKLMYPTGGSVQLTMMSSTEYQGEFYFSENRKVTLSTSNIGNSPIVAYTVLEHNGRKVGYLAYNSFESGVVESPGKYDLELQMVFDEFVEQGIQELVIDLRYNGGGLVSSCQKLCSMIAPKEKLGELLFTLRHNAEQEAVLPESSKQLKLLENYAESNVNMSRVYVLTSEMSASASELLIVGLEGVGVDVTVVGLDTEGKNVGMDVTYKHVDGYDYEFAPVTFQAYNAQGYSEFSGGIRADFQIDEWEDLRSDGWMPLGDPTEVVLQMALNLMTDDASRASMHQTRSTKQSRVQRLKYDDPVRAGGILRVEEE